MTASQEQNKAILDDLKEKLIMQVKEKQQEYDKLQGEKEEVERERDDAQNQVSELKSDIDRIQKRNELEN